MGTEEAFTILPNFLMTGILAMVIGLAIVIRSIGFVHTRRGATILGWLFVLLFLFGGGIAAQIVFAPVTWAAARQINTPLRWWRTVLRGNCGRGLGRLWPFTLAIGSVSFLIGLYMAIFGNLPGMNLTDEQVLNICWSFIFGGGWGMFLVSFVAGFASDISKGRVPDGGLAAGKA